MLSSNVRVTPCQHAGTLISAGATSEIEVICLGPFQPGSCEKYSSAVQKLIGSFISDNADCLCLQSILLEDGDLADERVR